MSRLLIGTSWKMNFTSSEARAYLETVLPLLANMDDRDVFVLPPYTSIWVARDMLQGSGVYWGAQDVTPPSVGGHTGGVSARMLADLGCTFVEVGHAERRRAYQEDDREVGTKVAAVAREGMVPVLCVGEPTSCPLEEAIQVATSQALAAVDNAPSMPDLVVAYEPAWAIGGERPAETSRIAAVSAALRAGLRARLSPTSRIRIIYGGGVTEHDAERILAESEVDGLFVGHAALSPVAFAAIARTRLHRADEEGLGMRPPTR